VGYLVTLAPPYHARGCRLKRSRTSGAMKVGMSCFSATHQGPAEHRLSSISRYAGG
jgi:hypothetical protein